MLSIKSNGAGVLPVEGLQKSHQPITGTILIADDQATEMQAKCVLVNIP
jgi:hypothetical protein